MNNDELVLALKQAGDRIKNLEYALEAQRQILDKTSALNFKLQNKVMKYDEMLGDAEEKLRRLLADVKKMCVAGELCHICAFVLTEETDVCELADLDCAKCKSAECRCRNCRNRENWKWRGMVGEENG